MIKINRSSGDGTVKANFILPLSETPEPVSVVGDFNDWDALAHPLKKRSNGTRSTTLELERGERYSFKYLSDGGTWFNDPDAHAHDVNEFGETNSVIQT